MCMFVILASDGFLVALLRYLGTVDGFRLIMCDAWVECLRSCESQELD